MKKKNIHIKTDKLHLSLAFLIVAFGVVAFGTLWYLTIHQEGYRLMDILKGSASHAVQKSQLDNQ